MPPKGFYRYDDGSVYLEPVGRPGRAGVDDRAERWASHRWAQRSGQPVADGGSSVTLPDGRTVTVKEAREVLRAMGRLTERDG